MKKKADSNPNHPKAMKEDIVKQFRDAIPEADKTMLKVLCESEHSEDRNLHALAQKANPKVVEKLIEKPSEINKKKKQSDTIPRLSGHSELSSNIPQPGPYNKD